VLAPDGARAFSFQPSALSLFVLGRAALVFKNKARA
jgi:hypothetical protein